MYITSTLQNVKSQNVNVTIHTFCTVYVLKIIRSVTFTVWDVYVLTLLRLMILHFVQLRYVATFVYILGIEYERSMQNKKVKCIR
jgi:hypothetical protein